MPYDGANPKIEYTPPHAIITTDVPGRFGLNGSIFDEPAFGAQSSADHLAPYDPFANAVSQPGDAALIASLQGRCDIRAFFDFGSNYCFFGGTSAAAIVGRMFSLAISTGRLTGADGVALKAALAAATNGTHNADWDTFQWKTPD